jgi:hypothetical protein
MPYDQKHHYPKDGKMKDLAKRLYTHCDDSGLVTVLYVAFYAAILGIIILQVAGFWA